MCVDRGLQKCFDIKSRQIHLTPKNKPAVIRNKNKVLNVWPLLAPLSKERCSKHDGCGKKCAKQKLIRYFAGIVDKLSNFIQIRHVFHSLGSLQYPGYFHSPMSNFNCAKILLVETVHCLSCVVLFVTLSGNWQNCAAFLCTIDDKNSTVIRCVWCAKNLLYEVCV